MGTYLVTGAAGFIGMHVAERLLSRGDTVVGLDDLNPYYDPGLKRARLVRLRGHSQFRFVEASIADRGAMERVFREPFSAVVHLAAQPGVRYSLVNPHAYTESNLTGFLHVLEGCRHGSVGHLVYASSSSVYGANVKLPFAVGDDVDHPVSLYAATKKANELMAHTYSHLYDIPTTGLRFFTVYGPWGRPDMSPMLFAKAILARQPITVFNHGHMQRDFTYIDDVVEGVVRVADRPARPTDVAGISSKAPYALYNIGNHQPVPLLEFIEILERALGQRAVKAFQDMQPGDVVATFADVDDLMRDVGFRPATPLDEGIARFVAWYREYHRT